MNAKTITVQALRYLATYGPLTPDEIYDIAKDIERADMNDDICPFCSEVRCDEDCPLESVRPININNA